MQSYKDECDIEGTKSNNKERHVMCWKAYGLRVSGYMNYRFQSFSGPHVENKQLFRREPAQFITR